MRTKNRIFNRFWLKIVVFCNKTRFLATYKCHQSNHTINEFLESFTGHSISSIVCYRQGMRLYSYRFFIDPVRMGAGCNCRFGHFEQSKLAILVITFPDYDSFRSIKSIPIGLDQ